MIKLQLAKPLGFLMMKNYPEQLAKDAQSSDGLKRVIGQRGDLQTLIYQNVMDPLPGHTISTRSNDVIYIKKGSKIKKEWKPRQ